MEPDLQWERVVVALRDLVNRFDVSLVVGFHGIPMGIPHTRPLSVTAHATRRELIEDHTSWFGTVKVPGSLAALFELRLGESGHDAVGFTVHVRTTSPSRRSLRQRSWLSRTSSGPRARAPGRGARGLGTGCRGRGRASDDGVRRGRRGGACARGAVRRVRPVGGSHEPARGVGPDTDCGRARGRVRTLPCPAGRGVTASRRFCGRKT
ncbi:PAC2 family protein [Oerskovia sp. M15]